MPIISLGPLAAMTALLMFATPAAGDVATDWNDAALNAIRSNRTAPPLASRSLAILHVSIYDAVNGIAGTHEPFYVRRTSAAQGSAGAAASAAAHAVLTSLFPASADAFDALNIAILAQIPDGRRKRSGLAWGQSVAGQILLWRANDNSDATVAPPVGSGPGAWVPTPPAFVPYLLPQWARVTPFAIPTGASFRPAGPPALDSPTYAGDYNEVKALGVAAGSSRTDDQTEIALFWADGGGTETPPGHWNSIARQIGIESGNTLEENARLFALLNVAMADAAICAWDAKFAFNFWRPITAIRQGDVDGNDATEADPDWNSLIVNPPFPDYASGHSTFSGAAARVLARFFGTDAMVFTAQSDALPEVTRTFSNFSSAAEEAMVSRVLGGIHFKSAGQDGLEVGQAIGDWTWKHTMRRIQHRRGHQPTR